MVVYGSMLCPDCVRCLRELDRRGMEYEYRDFAENLLWLREFLKLRDSEILFAEVKAAGKIGIPCIVYGDGTVSLTW